jgi:hypothetical protein
MPQPQLDFDRLMIRAARLLSRVTHISLEDSHEVVVTHQSTRPVLARDPMGFSRDRVEVFRILYREGFDFLKRLDDIPIRSPRFGS